MRQTIKAEKLAKAIKSGKVETAKVIEEQEKKVDPADPEFGDVFVKPGKMSREGDVKFDFSRPLHVPGFIKGEADENGRRRLYIQNFENCPQTGKRRLLGLSELDVGRDVVKLKYVTKTDPERRPIDYYLDMGDWTEKNLGLAIVFADPLNAGRGMDNVMTSLRNPNMFIAKNTGTAITEKNSVSVKKSGTQMPKGVSEKEMQTKAGQA